MDIMCILSPCIHLWYNQLFNLYEITRFHVFVNSRRCYEIGKICKYRLCACDGACPNYVYDVHFSENMYSITQHYMDYNKMYDRCLRRDTVQVTAVLYLCVFQATPIGVQDWVSMVPPTKHWLLSSCLLALHLKKWRSLQRTIEAQTFYCSYPDMCSPNHPARPLGYHIFTVPTMYGTLLHDDK